MDVVFKLLLTKEPVLLKDMLESNLARDVNAVKILNPGIPGDLASDKRSSWMSGSSWKTALG